MKQHATKMFLLSLLQSNVVFFPPQNYIVLIPRQTVKCWTSNRFNM